MPGAAADWPSVEGIPVVHEAWRPSYRIVPSRFPPINVFESVADPADLEAVFQVESLTNPRLREEAGELHLVAPADRMSGPGTTPIMAAFTHLNPNGSRFSDGSFGIYYAARAERTAIFETVYHQALYLADADDPPMELDMRVYCADLCGDFHDIRGLRETHPEWYDADSYAGSQPLGSLLRSRSAWGILYESVRHRGGECAAALRPPVLSPCRQGKHLSYVWDGSRITHVYSKDLYLTL